MMHEYSIKNCDDLGSNINVSCPTNCCIEATLRNKTAKEGMLRLMGMLYLFVCLPTKQDNRRKLCRNIFDLKYFDPCSN